MLLQDITFSFKSWPQQTLRWLVKQHSNLKTDRSRDNSYTCALKDTPQQTFCKLENEEDIVGI